MPAPSTNLTNQYIAGTGYTLGVSPKIQQWDDQSGNGNHLTQATTTKQPEFSVDALGNPIVSFLRLNATNGNRTMASTGPSGLTSRTMSIWVVGRMVTNSGCGIVSMNGLSTAMLRQVVSTSITPSLYAVSVPSALRASNNYGLWGLVSGASSVVHTAYESSTGAPVTSVSGTGGIQIGAINSAGTDSSYAAMEVKEILIYNAVQSAPDVALTKAYLIAKYGLAVSYTRQIVIEGDSISAGYDTTQSNQTYPIQLAENPAISRQWRIINQAASGSLVATMTARAASTDGLLIGSGYTRQVLMVMIGKNDVGEVGATGATVYANLISYLAARATAGWPEIWVGTCISTSNPGDEGRQNDLNTLIRSSIMTDVPKVKRIIDFGLQPEFLTGQIPSVTLNLSNYQTDGGHPSVGGRTVMARVVKPQLLAATNTPSSFFVC